MQDCGISISNTLEIPHSWTMPLILLAFSGTSLTNLPLVLHICVSESVRLVSAEPLPKPIWVIVNWTLTNKLQWNFNQNTKLFIHENVFENVVWKMAAILPLPLCVKLPRAAGIPCSSVMALWPQEIWMYVAYLIQYVHIIAGFVLL